MLSPQPSFIIYVDTNIYPSALHLPTSLFQAHILLSYSSQPQTTTPVHIASLSPRCGVVTDWEPYPRPTNPMRHNLDLAEDSLNSQDLLMLPPLAYSPSSLPSYSPIPTSPLRFPVPPIDFEAYTEEYGDIHPAYALRGTVGPDRLLWDAWANVGYSLLSVLPGWSIILQDDYDVFIKYMFEGVE